MTAHRSRSESSVVALSTMPSPVGPLHIAASGDVLYGIAFDRRGARDEVEAFLRRHLKHVEIATAEAPPERIREQLERYFAGKLHRFSIKTHLLGTDFQLQVLTALRTVPFGTTVSYKAVAEMIGNPAATRAVGGALGRNPIPIVIPCHRVVGEDGGLVGFGGGIDRKRKLLRLENVLLV
jgi:O-6-methylguanine DNA methyltransferase